MYSLIYIYIFIIVYITVIFYFKTVYILILKMHIIPFCSSEFARLRIKNVGKKIKLGLISYLNTNSFQYRNTNVLNFSLNFHLNYFEIYNK